MSTPICFISYSQEDHLHTNWVRKFATELRKQGVDVIWDKWILRPGMDLMLFMENGLEKSDYVLLICTPTYAEKAKLRVGGVGYEQLIITAEIYSNQSAGKFIPILRKGNRSDSIPSFLKTKVSVDFTNDELFEENLEELLRHFHGVPKNPEPEIGPVPTFLPKSEEELKKK